MDWRHWLCALLYCGGIVAALSGYPGALVLVPVGVVSLFLLGLSDWLRDRAARAAMHRWARARGFAIDGVTGELRLWSADEPPFRRGFKTRYRVLVEGSHRDRPVQLCDFAYRSEHEDGPEPPWTRLSVAVLRLPEPVATASARHERRLSRGPGWALAEDRFAIWRRGRLTPERAAQLLADLDALPPSRLP